MFVVTLLCLVTISGHYGYNNDDALSSHRLWYYIV